MAKETIRLGGMALPNGVLVHGPHAWACAIRGEDGQIEVVSARKRIQASRIKRPLLRGRARARPPRVGAAAGGPRVAGVGRLDGAGGVRAALGRARGLSRRGAHL